jgi:hypothetical protein
MKLSRRTITKKPLTISIIVSKCKRGRRK